jgi:cytochrome c oxidase assembly protein subunit 15
MMSVGIFQRVGGAGAIEPALPGERRWARRLDDPRTPDAMRRALLVISAVLAMPAFVLAVGNRFSGGPLFAYVPDVSLVPPMSKAAWEQAFVIHQQSPLFALCGSYQVGGMESLTVYQFLYWWEWLRFGGVALLACCLVLLTALTVRDAMRPQARRDLLVLIAATLLLSAYLILRYFADRAGLFATINVGQHRHAVDVTFASVALALLIVECLPAGAPAEPVTSRAVWTIALALDIAFGAMFQTTDASAVWKTFPAYGDALLPGTDRLFAFQPTWRNFTENPYFIQAAHRLLSFALWGAALASWLACWWRGRGTRRAALLFALLTLQAALGVATLLLDLPIVLSIAHQFCSVLVLVAALMPSASWRRSVAGAY